MRISLIPASSAGRPLDQHRVILKKIGGWVKNNASEMRVFKQKTEREIELGEGDNYINDLKKNLISPILITLLNRPAQWMKRTYFYWGVQSRPGSWREK